MEWHSLVLLQNAHSKQPQIDRLGLAIMQENILGSTTQPTIYGFGKAQLTDSGQPSQGS